MTRRNEDSGLIDLDALMREAATKDAGAGAAAPTSAPSAPTPPPSAIRTEARNEAPAPAPSAPKPSSSAAVAPPPASSAPASSQTEGRATVRPPAQVEREKRSSYSDGDALAIVSIAKAIEPPKSENDVVPAAAASAAQISTPPAKAVPPAPSTMPSKLEPDSLEAVTTERATDAPKSASASASIPPVTERSTAGASKPSRRGTQIAIGAAAALALLAGTAFMRSRSAASAANQVTTAAPTSAPSNLDKPTPAPAPEPTETANAGLATEDLPAVAASASAAPTAHALARVGGVLPKPAAKAAENTGPAKLTEADLAGGGPSAAGDLGDAMRGAVGARDQAGGDKPAETTTGPNAKQVRPSPGAVVGALGSVLPTARACLQPDDTVRSGLVVFNSDGTVARVDIKGSKPEDECVRAALSKAKLAPFVDETFSTRVTVRP